MGYKQSEIAYHAPNLKGSENFVLWGFILHANEEQGNCTFVSQGTLAEEIGTSRARVSEAQKRLEKLGYITVDRKFRPTKNGKIERAPSVVTANYSNMVRAYQLELARNGADADTILKKVAYLDGLHGGEPMAGRTVEFVESPVENNAPDGDAQHAPTDDPVPGRYRGLYQDGTGGSTEAVQPLVPARDNPLYQDGAVIGNLNKEVESGSSNRELSRELSFTVNAAASTPATTPRTSTGGTRKAATTSTAFTDYENDPRNLEARAALRAVIVKAAKLKNVDPDKYDALIANELMDALVEHYSYEVADFCEHQFNDVPTMCENPYMAGKWLTTLLKTAADRRGIDVRPSKIIDAELAADNAWQDQLAHIDEATSNDNTELDKSA